jgi:hypothetical protein
LPFPMLIVVPLLPVLVEMSVMNPFIVPRVPAPVTVSVVSSPPWVYVIIEGWNTPIMTPAPAIIA